MASAASQLTFSNYYYSEALSALGGCPNTSNYQLTPSSDPLPQIVDNVYIIPGELLFEDAYEGKEYKKRLVIHNRGKKLAKVQFDGPTAKAFNMKPLTQLTLLPPGMKIIRNIRYKYFTALGVTSGQIIFNINRQEVYLNIKVSLSVPRLVAHPTEIDFGTIDVGTAGVEKYITLSNLGQKSTHFSMDTGGVDNEVTLIPEDNYVEANGSVKIKVEVMGFTAGHFEKEFWIKTNPPIRIRVLGEFRTPKLKSLHPCTYTDFTLIKYSRIYVGMQRTKILLIKNDSSSDVMYCLMKYKQVKLFNDNGMDNNSSNNRHFNIIPPQGLLPAQKTAIIQIVYKPLGDAEEDVHIVSFMEVRKVEVIPMGNMLVKKGGTPVDEEQEERKNRGSFDTNILSGEEVFEELKVNDSITCEELFNKEGGFTVCLYGEFERAHITLQPKILSLNNLIHGETYTREITMKNCSLCLPVNYEFQNALYMLFEPREGTLKPNETRQMILKIIPVRAGNFKIRCVVNLRYYYEVVNGRTEMINVGSEEINVNFSATLKDQVHHPKFVPGITPFFHNEIGLLVDDIKFSSNLPMPRQAVLNRDPKVFNRNNNALVAFPNDRPEKMRPWRAIEPCLTIFAKLPRIAVSRDEFTLTKSESALMHKNLNYWDAYVKNLATQHKKIAKNEHICRPFMRKDLKKWECNHIEECAPMPKQPFVGDYIPLTPIQVYRIIIKPKYLRLKKVVPKSSALEKFTIDNTNEFSVHIMLTTKKPGISFPGGTIRVIKPFEKITCLIKCSPGAVGKYINEVNLIINYNHITKMSVMAEAVPKSVELDLTDIVFDLTVASIKYIKLKNMLNSNISFVWDIPYSRFSVKPHSAIIPPKRTLLCMIKYEAVLNINNAAEAVLTSEGGSAKLVSITHKPVTPAIALHGSKEMKMGEIPLNIPVKQIFALRNLSNFDVCFETTLDDENTVRILPQNGIIKRKTDVEFTVWITKKSVADFKHVIDILIEGSFKHTVAISGTVVYPDVLLKPDLHINRKMVPYSYRATPFVVKNQTQCIVNIKFSITELTEFYITSTINRYEKRLHNTNIQMVAKESRTFYLHLMTTEASVISFYVPIVLNDMIGPPNLGKAKSVESGSYVDGTQCLSKTIPKKIPLLKFINVVSQQTVEISTFEFEWSKKSKHDNKQIKIINRGKDPLELCIRTEKLERTPFSFKFLDGHHMKKYPISYVNLLKPGEYSSYVAHFNPEKYGEYECHLPIYIRNYQDGTVFNFIRFYGNIPPPLITCDTESICFDSLPLSVRTSRTITLELSDHHNDCALSANDAKQMQWLEIYIHEKLPGKHKQLVVTVSFMGNRPITFCEKIVFECQCPAKFTLPVSGITDNSILVNHAFYSLYEDFYDEKLEKPSVILLGGARNTKDQRQRSSLNNLIRMTSAESGLNLNVQFVDHEDLGILPYFPEDKDTSDYAVHQREILTAVENWVYTQGFHGKVNFSIPETFAMDPVDIILIPDEHRHHLSNFRQTPLEPNLILLMICLRGPSIRREIITTKPEKEIPGDIAYHYFLCYSNLLKYMERHGVGLVHAEPEYFLHYEHYLQMFEYCSDLLQSKVLLNKERFTLLGRQVYIDCILMFIKLFYLYQVPSAPASTASSKIMNRELRMQDSTLTNYTGNNEILDNLHSKQELSLLYWLQTYYDKTKQTLWKNVSIDATSMLRDIEVKSFGKVLSDGLVLACVIAGHCTYTQNYFEDMFLNPKRKEEYFHNACKISKIFVKLNFSYILQPQDIIEANCVNMLLLTLYLYDILPSMSPVRAVEFEAKLTQSVKIPFVLANNDEQPIVYKVFFFENEHNTFSTPSEFVRVNPKMKTTVQIFYEARKIFPTSTVLIFSGDCPGQKYGRNIVVQVNGIPDNDHAVKLVEVKAVYYKMYKLKLKLQSPYNVPDTFEIFYNSRKGHRDKNTDIYSWEKYITLNFPQRIHSESHVYELTDVKDGFIFEPVVCCSIPETQVYTLYFIGKHGDWGLRITTIPKIDSRIHEIINVPVPLDFNISRCICDESGKLSLSCPRTLHIDIPSKNNLFWTSMKEILVARISDNYDNFWKKYIGSKIGFYILKEFLKVEPEVGRINGFTDILTKAIDFSVSILEKDGKSFTTLPRISIEDVLMETIIKLPLQADKNLDLKKPTFIKLDSPQDRRYYKLIFAPRN